jgi:hypothetical protein
LAVLRDVALASGRSWDRERVIPKVQERVIPKVRHRTFNFDAIIHHSRCEVKKLSSFFYPFDLKGFHRIAMPVCNNSA